MVGPFSLGSSPPPPASPPGMAADKYSATAVRPMLSRLRAASSATQQCMPRRPE